ncbi:fasciclin domain-containing protein [Devosia sp. XJ19-1]|uniref:Fasciclin domain-containing protein n=1 Tax=Devosia ureilytica TaxID=2952754 RepID=A0A9Q4FTZ0_9HYPH|nr:fasciclin domain-containing protein [Devosia ureilytica]MCP8884514.1 fasciclin domain-containing protein [Devosia ureilytica]MCP8888144.1 fasciclin domain-containing protein [Devosia ureilytica]
MTLSIRALSLAAVLTLGSLSGAAFAQENPMVGGAAMPATNNIVENAVNSADHTTLVAAVQAAGLVETLSGEGPFTVFAPVNAAFEALPAGTVEGLLAPEAKDQLTAVLTYHVIAGDIHSGDLVKMINDNGGEYKAATVQGGELTFSLDGDMVKITDANGGMATVTIADVDQSNGVIHVIDAVLLPAM